MIRTRFEVLEKRQMFAASSLSDAVEAYVLMNCPNDFMARPEEVVVEGEARSAAGRPAAPVDISHTYDGDLRLTVAGDTEGDGNVHAAHDAGGQEGEEVLAVTELSDDKLGNLMSALRTCGRNVTEIWSYDHDLAAIVGDFNGDGTDDLASFTGRRAMILPYIEQDNLYKSQAAEGPQGGNAAVLITSIPDGTSNTIMFRGATGDDGAGSRSVIDISEHAFAERTEANANGIIAILIGLAADPSDPSGNTVRGSGLLVDPCPPPPRRYDGTADRASALGSEGETALAANFCLCDGSVRFLRVDTTGMADLQKAMAASDESAIASLVASDEYFALLSNNHVYADELAVSVLLGNGDGTFRVRQVITEGL